MYLKEAFRYQNYLSSLLNLAIACIRDRMYNQKVVQEHLRSKVNPEAEDETIDSSTARVMPYNAENFVGFAIFVLKEKTKLTNAISAAKKAHTIDIDAEISLSRLRQQIIGSLNSLSTIKPTERVIKAYSYKFNAEGNQVQYTYDVKETSTPDFNKEKIRKLAKELVSDVDNTSTLIDMANFEVLVEYEPCFDINDSFEEAMEIVELKTKWIGLEPAT